MRRVVQRAGTWVGRDRISTTLPAEADAFVGRTADLRALWQHVGKGAALLSVTGLGGAGKTRLAVHFAWSRLVDFPGGAWFCDLSEARDQAGVVRAVAVGLGVQLDRGDAVRRLGHAIGARGRCLVVLDNVEQVVEHASTTVGEWLAVAPEAQFLVTTRHPLGVSGERVVPLPPMSIARGGTAGRALRGRNGRASQWATRRPHRRVAGDLASRRLGAGSGART